MTREAKKVEALRRKNAATLFAAARNELGDDMGLLCVTALGYMQLLGDKKCGQALSRIRANCKKSGVDIGL